jgi:hypothetical protein
MKHSTHSSNSKTFRVCNHNTKRLAYTALIRPILEYWAVCWDPYRVGRVSALNQVQARAAKFTNNTDQMGWEALSDRRLVSRLCALFKAYSGNRAWKAIEDRLLRPHYLSREDHNRKIRSRKQRTDIGKFSFVNRTIISWNQLPADLQRLSSLNWTSLGRELRNLLQQIGLNPNFRVKSEFRTVYDL